MLESRVQTPIQTLRARCPTWFTIDTSTSSSLVGIANVAETVWAESGIALVIEGHFPLTVRERVPGTNFPARCPERHIQRDQTFCLGLRSLEVASQENAMQWWEQLRQFICCQSTAEKTGIWPPSHALDHGDAGHWHERALIAARELGIEEDYAGAYLGDPSWITNRKHRFFDKHGKPTNGRAPCPIGCTYKGRPFSSIVRKDCKRRALVLELVASEQQRRVQLKKYWDAVRAAGETCCGKMKVCGLR